ncbi:MAG: tripartite tricarboxylate transporter TctB family protein [Thermodesulfobacteriota bacterium]
MTTKPRKEIAVSVVLIVFSLLFLAYSTRYPLDTWENPGPAVFPLILGAMLLIMATWQLVGALRAAKRAEHKEPETAGPKSLRGYFQDNREEAKVIYLCMMLAGYILAMRRVGFFVSTFLLVILASRLVEAKSWGRPITLSAGVCLGCYLLFELWLKLSLSRGILF